MHNLTKEWKWPPTVLANFAKSKFLQYIYSVIVAKNHQKIQSRCFFLHRYFLTILIMVTMQFFSREVLCGSFRFIWMWLLITIVKRYTEGCTLQLYCTSLKLMSHSILHYSWSAYLLKAFSQLIVSIFTFLNQKLVIFSQ